METNNQVVTKTEIKFVGIDNWSRPVFKDVKRKIYYGSTFTLLPCKIVHPNDSIDEINSYFRKNIDELEYFGNHFGCEPHGGLNKNIELVIV